jgi:hypothetical protein
MMGRPGAGSASSRSISVAAFRVEAPRDGDRLEERRLARAVLADEERDLRMQLEHIEVPHRRQGKGIVIEGGNLLAPEANFRDVLPRDQVQRRKMGYVPI